jgi:signal transduction histidine kinase
VEVVRRTSGLEVSLEAGNDAAVDPSIEREAYRIVQEALNNAVKHSGAHSISVAIVATDGRLRVAVRDDGSGFDPKALPVRAKHLGLTSMEERTRRIGGTLRIDSSPGAGTTVTLEVGS